MDAEERKDIENKAARAAYLLYRHLNNTLTENEDEELATWIKANEQNWKIFQEFNSDEFKRKLLAAQAVSNKQ